MPLVVVLACAAGCARSGTSAAPDDSGVVIETITAGKGPHVEDGQLLTVHYVGAFKDGTKFDSSRDRGAPFQLRLGSHQVIPGWEMTLAKLHVGDRVKATIPWTLAYGAQGMPPVIPPKADLVFDIEVLDAK